MSRMNGYLTTTTTTTTNNKLKEEEEYKRLLFTKSQTVCLAEKNVRKKIRRRYDRDRHRGGGETSSAKMRAISVLRTIPCNCSARTSIVYSIDIQI